MPCCWRNREQCYDFETRVTHVSIPAIVFCLLIATSLAAHDFYLLPSAFSITPGTKIKIAFHNGDSFPQSEAAPSLARLQEAQLLFAGGKIAVEGLQTEGKYVLGTVAIPEHPGDLVVSARTVPNLIELPSEQFLAYLKEEGLSSVMQWRSQHNESQKPGRERYSKFAKSLLVSGAPDDFYQHVIGFPIEIVPKIDPSTLHAGSSLPVKIIFQGKPAAGLQVEAAWTESGQSKTTVVGRTDEGGLLSIPLSSAGRWRLHSLKMERCTEPAVADWESFWTSLTFEIR